MALIETERISIRRFTPEDAQSILAFLGDPEVMYAWEHGFSEEEAQEWLKKNLDRYAQYGYGWMYAEEKSTKEGMGTFGLIYTQDIAGESGYELGYILKKGFWGKGYAKEGALACARYALEELGEDRVFAQMRTNNTASRAVAEAIGMEYVTTYDRHYTGKILPHHVYQMCGKKQG